MTDPEKIDHWQSLVEQIGATPSRPKEDISPQSQPTQTPRPIGERPKPRPLPPPPSKRHWQLLAGELGLEIPPEIFAPDDRSEDRAQAASSVEDFGGTPVEQHAAPKTDFRAMAGDASETLQAAAELQPEEMERESKPFDDFGSESLADDEAILDEIEERSPPGEGEVEAPEGEGERNLRRRRRRRGRRRRTSEASHLDTASEPFHEDMDELDDDESIEDDAEAADLEHIDSATAIDTEEQEGRRPRRRRRRRRRKVESSEAATSTMDADDDFVTIEESDTVESVLDEEVEFLSSNPESPRRQEPFGASSRDQHDDQDDHDEADEKDESDSSQPKHRKIPTWQEAITMVISANMEARSRSREGQRGRGRGRGGGNR